jgi:hypothetical protein
MNERFNPRFKVDTDKLEIGSIIATSELVDLVRATPKDRKWDSKLQQVCKYIEAQRSDLMAAVRRETIVILDGDERAEQVTKGLSRTIQSTISLAERANDPVRMAIDRMSPEVRRGFESVARTAAALAESTKQLAKTNARLAGLLAPTSETEE